ncbi:MAG TPA: AAA family ATPase [Candidatus Sulfotelmatobacter sp.]|nr:AAA family ATPase [Candidatus Sulfotelmatobacter sp.]
MKNDSKTILAFVGMPGAGKSESTHYLFEKGFPFVRFGQLTEEAIKEANLPLNTENERVFREKLRQEFGMEAFAVKAKPKLDELIKNHEIVVIDGLYSWEEYVYLKKYFNFLKLILIYAEPKIRYERLSKRKIRPISLKDSYVRDVREIEKLNKGGPIAIADFCIVNNSHNLNDLYKNIEAILNQLRI